MSSISGGPPPSSELSSVELFREMLALSDQLGQLSQFSREKLMIPKHGAAAAGVCVFHLAVLSGNERVIQEVEQVFPDLILKPTREGETALFYACFISKSSKQLARLIDLAQRYHPQPLQYAQELVSKQRAFPISLLLSILYPEPCRPSGSWTRWLSTEAYPLNGVKMEQRFDIASYIIRIWPESVAQLREHLTKEHIINSYLCYNIIQIGLGDQVLKDLVNREQRTPVHDFFIQTRIGQVEHLKAFAEAGIDLTSEDRNSYIPLEYANITKDGASQM